MARSGRAGPALATAAIGSFVAGTIGTLGIAFLAPVVVDWALKFGPAEYFALMILAFTTVSAVLNPPLTTSPAGKVDTVSIAVNAPLLAS
jgi:putative tricarboxylic transport membrane protein